MTMSSVRWAVLLLGLIPLLASAQQGEPDQDLPGPNQPLPRSTPRHQSNDEESSSRDTIIDLSPPADDAKNHTDSSSATDANTSDVQDFHPWDPHRAMKDVEVGDFYFKRHNYPAAVGRYREALLYKPNDAQATYQLAAALEKLGRPVEAQKNYQAYLKILPHGPQAEAARLALDRLKVKAPDSATSKAGPAPKSN
jgi:tetratricopeptide (TPR) repeat protein